MKPIMLKLDCIFLFMFVLFTTLKTLFKRYKKELYQSIFCFVFIISFAGILSIETFNKMQPDNNKERFDTINIK